MNSSQRGIANALTQLRQRIADQRGMMQDLTVEVAAMERYSEFPHIMDKLRELEQVVLIVLAQETTIARLAEQQEKANDS